MSQVSTPADRAPFLDRLADAYNVRGNNVVVLTGGVNDLFRRGDAAGRYRAMEETVAGAFADKFTVVRMDAATGISLYTEAAECEVVRVIEGVTPGADVPHALLTRFRSDNAQTQHEPLPSLVRLRGWTRAFTIRRTVERDRAAPEAPGSTKPLCIIVQHAGSLFPQGEWGRLSELDRQRLVFLLSWVTDPRVVGSPHLFLLITPVRSEVNDKILALRNTAHIEVQLPDEAERRRFVTTHTSTTDALTFEAGLARFCRDTAGLTLPQIGDILRAAVCRGRPVAGADVVRTVNEILQAELGDIIRVRFPTHTAADVVGFTETIAIFRSIFDACEDPDTAVPAVLVSGPNGGGKTYQLEAMAAESGRVTIELTGLRSQFFGETDRFFELLRWHIATLGNVLILVDEAHTAFGSVHTGQTHATERRLAGSIIKMMSDRALLGKVVWGLMTSRPDELDPDVKSRAPEQVPIFDPVGDERRVFVEGLFRRHGIALAEDELTEVLAQTTYYSARSYDYLGRRVRRVRRQEPQASVVDVLEGWQASRAIKQQREFQTLVAAQHCSYPRLCPPAIRALDDTEIARRIDALRHRLH